MMSKYATGAGVGIGVIGFLLSPQILDKLDGGHVFYLLLTSIILTSIGTSIIPAWRKSESDRRAEADKIAAQKQKDILQDRERFLQALEQATKSTFQD